MLDTNCETQLRTARGELNRRMALDDENLMEKEKADTALQNSEKRYRRLVESAKAGILILDADTGKVVDVNPFLLQLLGYSYDELCGQHLWEIGSFHDIAASKAAFKKLQDSEYIRYENLPLKTRDGKSVKVEFVSNVYLVDHSKVIHCNIRDITIRKQIISPKVIDLNEAVGGMLKMLQRLIGENIHLTWLSGAGRLWPIKMDLSHLDQILASLCINARDAIADVGKITIETGMASFDDAYCANHAGFVPGDFVVLAVSDDGSGMSKETQGHIFEPFYTTKKLGVGAGLGLSTVYGIVAQNEGFINFTSEPGQGTTFKVFFRRHKGAAVSFQKNIPAKMPKGHGETILVVDDEAAIRNLVKSCLEQLGYTVLAAGTPIEAIRLAETHIQKIRLVLTDVIMPEMNGRELAKRLISLKPNLKHLFMSGYTADVIADRGVLGEGLCFIQKPFSIKDLAAKVYEILGQEKTKENNPAGARYCLKTPNAHGQRSEQRPRL